MKASYSSRPLTNSRGKTLVELYNLYGRIEEFFPLDIDGALFVTKAENEDRNDWDTAGYQLDNEVQTFPPNQYALAMDFSSSNADYADFGNVGSVRSVTLKFKLDSTTETLFSHGPVSASIVSGSLSVNQSGFTAYIDDTTTLTGLTTGKWYQLTVIYASALAGTDFRVARSGTDYGDISVKDLAVFSSSITKQQSDDLFNSQDQQWIGFCRGYGASLVAPLADYSPEDGQRADGDIVLDYSGNSTDGDLFGNVDAATPVYAPHFGYIVREDKYNVVSGQYIFDTGNGTDIQGNPIPVFVGAAAPDAKAFTGGAIEFTSVNSDYVSIGDLGNIRRLSFWINLDTTTEDILQLSSTVYLSASSGTLSVTGTATETIYVNTVETSTIGTAWAYVNITFSADINADDVEIGRRGSSYGDFQIKDIQFYSIVISDTVYNLPNSFIENAQANCVAAYDCNQGTYSAGSPVIDVSGNGNHGIVQGASSEMALNNVEVGSQTATHGFTFYQNLGVIGTATTVVRASTTTIFADSADFSNVSINDLVVFEGSSRISKVIDIDFGDLIVSGNAGNFSFQNIIHYKLGQGTDNFIVPAISDKGTTDIFGNTVEAPWVEGLLNFTGFDPSRLDIGALNNSLYFDETSYTAFTVLNFNSSSGFPQLWSNMRFGTAFGQRLLVAGDGSLKFSLSNGSDVPALLTLESSADATTDKWHFVAITLSLNGDATIYYGDLDTPMAFDKSGNVGLRASSNKATRLLAFGKALGSSSASFPTVNGTLQNVFFAGELSLNEIEKLRKYFVKKIPS